MKIKVGDQVFDDESIPVMIILSEQDKLNIENMPTTAFKYALFPEDYGTKDEMKDWMIKV